MLLVGLKYKITSPLCYNDTIINERKHFGKELLPMKKTLILILALALLLCSTALADSVKAVANPTYVRTGPGLDYKSIGILHRGEDAPYLGKTSTDDRGVVWYKIRWNGRDAWVSSMYTCKVKY
jgi:uncharacterized protein YraI